MNPRFPFPKKETVVKKERVFHSMLIQPFFRVSIGTRSRSGLIAIYSLSSPPLVQIGPPLVQIEAVDLEQFKL